MRVDLAARVAGHGHRGDSATRPESHGVGYGRTPAGPISLSLRSIPTHTAAREETEESEGVSTDESVAAQGSREGERVVVVEPAASERASTAVFHAQPRGFPHQVRAPVYP